jgi:hypothetical protein
MSDGEIRGAYIPNVSRKGKYGIGQIKRSNICSQGVKVSDARIASCHINNA